MSPNTSKTSSGTVTFTLAFRSGEETEAPLLRVNPDQAQLALASRANALRGSDIIFIDGPFVFNTRNETLEAETGDLSWRSDPTGFID
jgi:hypothetical protein